MTLSEFLLARIAEDEELWLNAHDAGMVMTIEGVSAIPPSGFTLRMARDAQAKRQLIERIGHPAWAGFRILALPFADHPDYDEDWRP